MLGLEAVVYLQFCLGLVIRRLVSSRVLESDGSIALI